MIDKKQLINELLECVQDATDTETKITGLTMCATLFESVLDEAINYSCSCKSDSELLPDVYLQELSKVEWTPQTQASLNEQLQILRQFANKLGLYDASDYLKK